MSTIKHIDDNGVSIVRMKSSEFWINLSLRRITTHRFGYIVHLADQAAVFIEPADELSSSYQTENWMSAVMSGVLYAFRALHIPRQKLALEALSGRLRSTDMDALANCSALATAALVNMEIPQLDLGDWVAEVETTDTVVVE
jgi:hypothetical protein